MDSALFPPGTKVFRLRFDFAIELGYLDRVREPRTVEEFASLQEQAPGSYSDSLAAHNLRRPDYVLPRFMVYFGALYRGAEPFQLISDGWEVFLAESGGLWDDLLGRVASARGTQRDGQPLIVARQEPSKEEWMRPRYVVLHDTSEGLATVVEYNQALSYLPKSPLTGPN